MANKIFRKIIRLFPKVFKIVEFEYNFRVEKFKIMNLIYCISNLKRLNYLELSQFINFFPNCPIFIGFKNSKITLEFL